MHICPERALCSSPDEMAPEDDLRSFFVGGKLQGSSLLSLLRGYTVTQSISISGDTGNRSEQPCHAVDTHMPQPRHIVSPFGPSIWTSTTANPVQPFSTRPRCDYPPLQGTPNSATTIFTAGGQRQTTPFEDAPPRFVKAQDRLVWIQKRAEWFRAAALMNLGSAEESRPETAELPEPLSTTHPDNHVPHALLTELGPINHSAYPSHLPSVDTPEIRSAARSIKRKYSSGPFHTEGEGYLHQFQDEICNMGWKDLAVIRLSLPLSSTPVISLEHSSRRPDRKCGGDIFSTSNPLLTGSHFTRYFATVPESYACPPFNAVVDKQDLDPFVIPMRRLVDRLDPRTSTSSSPANSSDSEVTAITRSSEYELSPVLRVLSHETGYQPEVGSSRWPQAMERLSDFSLEKLAGNKPVGKAHAGAYTVQTYCPYDHRHPTRLSSAFSRVTPRTCTRQYPHHLQPSATSSSIANHRNLKLMN